MSGHERFYLSLIWAAWVTAGILYYADRRAHVAFAFTFLTAYLIGATTWGDYILAWWIWVLLVGAGTLLELDSLESWTKWEARDPQPPAPEDEWPSASPVSRDQFDEALAEELAALPEETQAALAGVSVTGAFSPTEDEIRAAGLDPAVSSLAGVYGGASLQFRVANLASGYPSFIKIYFGPIWQANGDAWREALPNVVLHEVGHALGMDHAELAAHGV